MEGLNDVVRHIILRIVVDQAGFAEGLATAREKLKALKDSEREISKDRIKTVDGVSKAYEKQSSTLDATAQETRKVTGEIKEQTKELEKQAAAAEKAQKNEQKRAEKAFRRAHTQAFAEDRRRTERADKALDDAHVKAIQEERRRTERADKALDDAHVKAIQEERRRTEQAEAALNTAHSQAFAEDRRRADSAEAKRTKAHLQALAEERRRTKVAKEEADKRAKDEEAALTKAHLKALALNVQFTQRQRAEAARQKEHLDKVHARALAMDAQRTARLSKSPVRNESEALTRLHRQALAEDDRRTEAAKVKAKQRADQEIREAKRAQREIERLRKLRQRGSVTGGAEGLVNDFFRVVSAVASSGRDDTRIKNAAREFREVREETGRAEAAVKAFFGVLTPGLANGARAFRDVRRESGAAHTAVGAFFRGARNGGGEAASAVDHIAGRVRNLFELFKPASRGGGGLIGNIFGNVGLIGNSFMHHFEGMSRHLLSFRGLIVAVIVALGPLAAILGAVGAAALGLASNLAALSGVLFALPGVIGALVAGFGSLALVMKPLSNVFSAYEAAQKEATKSTQAAKTAALDYKDALLSRREAELAHIRALQDGPRLQRALNDARRDATRQIEDYRTALKKLKFDEEGSELGVLSAQQAYRRALADPTASALDRAQALHNVQGAMFDEQDQVTNAKRTREDAARAIKLGVDGSDAVVNARRALEDQTLKIQQTEIALAKAVIATNKAYLEKQAGGTAAATFKKELDKLPPLTRKVAEAVLDLIKPGGPFQKLRDKLSDKIFGPLAADTGRFSDVIELLDRYLTPAAEAMGKLADQALRLLTSREWKNFFDQAGKDAADLLTKMGEAALAVADGFRGIVTAAAPFTSWLVGAIGKVAEQFGRWANSTQGQKGIASFLELTKRRLQEIWPIITNLAAGFAGFFAALNTPAAGDKKDFTTQLNEGLLGAAKSFRKLGEAAADPNSGFHKWLHNVMPLLKDVGHFLAQAGRAFGKLFSDKRNLDEAQALLRTIADKWLPRLAEIFSKLSESGFVSKLSKAIGAVFGAIESFFDHGGLTALKVFANTLGHIATAIEWLTQHMPALASAIGLVATGLSFAFGMVLIRKIAEFTAKISGLKFVWDTFRSALSKRFSWVTPPAPKPGSGGAGAGGVTGGGAGSSAELVVLRRMETYLRQIAINTGSAGVLPDETLSGSGSDDAKKKPKGYKSKHRRGARAVVEGVEEGAEDVAKSGWFRRLLGRAGGVMGSDAGSVAVGSLLGLGSTGAAGAAGTAAAGAGRSGLLGRLMKGARGGIVSAVLATAAQYGGDMLIDRYVKNDRDRGSLSRGLGAVATGAGIGATIGSIVPGVGTAIGGVVGGAVGGAYSLVRDQNLRNFLGNKINTAAANTRELASSGVGGFTQAALGPVGALASKTDIGKSIFSSLNRAGSRIGAFFTQTIPGWFNRGVRSITNFFTRTLPSLPGRAFDAFFVGVGRMIRFFTVSLPRAAGDLFLHKIPAAAASAWHFVKTNLWQPFVGFIRGIPHFFTRTIPHWFSTARKWAAEHIRKPLHDFITKDIPEFFTTTIPRWFHEAPKWFHEHVVVGVTDFFTKTLPNFFTKTLPDAISKLPGFLYDNLVQPILDFFKGLAGHVGDLFKGEWNWVKGLFNRASGDIDKGRQGKMSGGLIEGIYQGIEDKAHILATPGEFMVRKSKVDQPGAKAFLRDFNEGRVSMDDLYKGLSASMQPPVMSMVPPSAAAMTGAVPTVINHTVNHAPLTGDITINNPVPQPAERSLRHQIQVAAIRHRR